MPRSKPRSALLVGGLSASVAAAGVLAALIAVLLGVASAGSQCGAADSGQVAVGLDGGGPPGTGEVVGSTEYGGPGDPSSGTVGASGMSLLAHPDSYAELGGDSFQTATAMGGLPYMTPLRITWGGHSAIAYKRDFGLGGGPIQGRPRVIDLWWQLAGALGIPYDDGLWSGIVRISRPPSTGAASLLGQGSQAGAAVAAPAGAAPAGAAPAGAAPAGAAPAGSAPAGSQDPAFCAPQPAAGVPITTGERALLLPDGRAAAPAAAPAAVKQMIAAGNQIVGKPYLYGGGHGLALSEVAPAYDCSSSVEHLLYGGGLLPPAYTAPSGTLEEFGRPGPGAWVTLYASPGHVFMYVAGLRWDTWDAAGPGDGSNGIGWHPLIRSSAGFVARHPVGL